MKRIIFSNFKKVLKQENINLNLKISLSVLIKLDLCQNKFVLLEIWIKSLFKTNTVEKLNMRKEFLKLDYSTLSIDNLSIQKHINFILISKYCYNYTYYCYTSTMNYSRWYKLSLHKISDRMNSYQSNCNDIFTQITDIITEEKK